MRLESLWGDIRFAFRIFKRSPAVALTVIGTLAVALGLNATAYSFFNAYVVKPAAVHDPGTLYQASWENRGGFFHRFSWTEAARFGREMAGVFPETYVSTAQLLTRINGRPAVGELVTGNYFSLLGVPAVRGRMLRPSDSEAPGREPVVVLSHAAWMRLFGADPAAVGQQLQIRGVYVEIVGIAAEGFVGLDLLPRDFWAPLTLLPAFEEGPSLFGPEQPQRLDVVGRLGANQTEGSARAAVLAWAQRTTASNPPETQRTSALPGLTEPSVRFYDGARDLGRSDPQAEDCGIHRGPVGERQSPAVKESHVRQGSLGGRSHEEGRRTVGQPHPARGGCRMTLLYPIVLETEDNGAVSAYVPGLPVYAAAATSAKAERAIRAVLMAYLQAHPASRPGARVRVARFSDKGKTKVDIVGVAALVGAQRSATKARASRANGRLGGRPRKTTVATPRRARAPR